MGFVVVEFEYNATYILRLPLLQLLLSAPTVVLDILQVWL